MNEPFGVTQSGHEVRKLTISNGALTASVLTYGAILQSVRLQGVSHDLTLGSDQLADYENEMIYHGAAIGPVANRISGAKAVIAGRTHQFEANQDGRITLHSGTSGIHSRVWTVLDHGAHHVVLGLDLPDGDGGFPGNRHLTARYDLAKPTTLRLTLGGTTDADTLMNLTNHSYWSLDGGETWAGHSLKVAADSYLPVDADFAPTGAIAPVDDTAMDFRAGRQITPRDASFDHNFCLGGSGLREVLWLSGQSGVSMSLATNQPGLQLYDGRGGIRPGHQPYEGIAIEAQGWPDAPNQPQFPSVLLLAGQSYVNEMEWRFSR